MEDGSPSLLGCLLRGAFFGIGLCAILVAVGFCASYVSGIPRLTSQQSQARQEFFDRIDAAEDKLRRVSAELLSGTRGQNMTPERRLQIGDQLNWYANGLVEYRLLMALLDGHAVTEKNLDELQSTTIGVLRILDLSDGIENPDVLNQELLLPQWPKERSPR